jgi:competence protein ComEC
VKASLIWLVLLGAGLLILVTFFMPPPADKVVFLDIGQGDSILLQDDTRQILIDGGPGTKVLERLGEELPWFDRRLEVVIATHPDQDHLEGLVHVIERYDVDLVVLPHIAHTTQLQDEWLERLQEAVAAKQIAYRFAWRGEEIKLADMQVSILGPWAEGEAPAFDTTNNASVITRIDFHGMSWLLSGDAERAVERALVAISDPHQLDVDVLKAGHHGSRTSTGAELLAATTPQVVVISAGHDNRFGHPHPEVVERLEPYDVMRTDQSGSIRFIYQQNQWLLNCAKACMKK